MDLPEDVTEDMKWMAYNASWHATNKTWGNFFRYGADLDNFNKHADSLEKYDWFDNSLFQNIKWCSWNLAWWGIGLRNGKESDIADSFIKAIEHCDAIADGLDTKTLIEESGY